MGRVRALAALAAAGVLGCAGSAADDARLPRRTGEVAESTFAWPVPNPEQAAEVEVRNAAGVNGLARDVTRRLRARGFDVVTYGSHDVAMDSTLILVRRGSPEAGERVRTALGQGLVRERRDSTRRVDVTVILGRDYSREP